MGAVSLGMIISMQSNKNSTLFNIIMFVPKSHNL